ncbi:MAG: methyltransferase domain-containing protein [Gemmatales bacterium]
MNEADRQEYVNRYRARLEQFGYDPRTLGWTTGKQLERFTAATQLVSINKLTSVLDVGCGFGDFYEFLKANDFQGEYHGIDFVPDLVEIARQRHPQAKFIVGDFALHSFNQQFDLVTASGIFNARLKGEEQRESTFTTIRKMASLARAVTSVDFLSTQADRRREDLYYSDPADLLEFAKTLTKRTALLQHYLPFEFCLYLFKDDTFDTTTRYHPILSNKE